MQPSPCGSGLSHGCTAAFGVKELVSLKKVTGAESWQCVPRKLSFRLPDNALIYTRSTRPAEKNSHQDNPRRQHNGAS